MNIVLLGYMGCGKSTIGNALASNLEIQYLDLDDYIQTKEKKIIREIFEEKGEIYFRKKENQYLQEVLQSTIDTVISLGGGTPCFAGNMELLKNDKKSKSIYLKTSLPELVDRLFPKKDKRPLIAHLSNRDDLDDFIRKHLFERSFYYNQAESIISTDNKTIKEIVAEIKTTLF